MPTDVPPRKSQGDYDAEKTIANSRKIATIFVVLAAVFALSTAVSTRAVGAWIFFALMAALSIVMYLWAFRKQRP